ncbi:YbaK/EbsC family protein [Microbacterium xanthum]|uniref:YbaK/EbsC family protein n=1 Tax=Microbacterium xanthum TaxID=3079794 RepID=UPI002AD4C5D4|nr:YbaK/EbsC family protein [Microbacterium sp. KSW-48]MDZ8173060.1 YbaK/EbsC family protein [Microbacterium sp. KSW-48]
MALDLVPALDAPHLLAPPVAAALGVLPPEIARSIRIAPIDPTLADTAAFCAAYDIRLADSANCIVVAGKRGDRVTYAACVVLATTRADVNGVVRRLLDARRASFAPMDDAVAMTGMEYGGITPLGLPADWRILVDSRVQAVGSAIIGAGIRGAKVALPGSTLCALPGVDVIEGLASD